jgi:hypothetical protein
MDYPLDDPHALYSKTPARIRASRGSICEANLRTRHRSRAKSWTWRFVADAKGSATGARPVESCRSTSPMLVAGSAAAPGLAAQRVDDILHLGA